MVVANTSWAGGEPKFFTLQQFAGMNTKATRTSIGDQEFSWLENMMPIGDGNLRALWSNGIALYTTSGGLTIIYYDFYNIGASKYAAVFLSDGTAVQVNTESGSTTTISANVGEFYPGDGSLGNPVPAIAQWGQSGIVIVCTSSSNGYFAWDGTTLYRAGDAAPNWLTGSTATTMPSGVSGTCVETYGSRVWVGDGANRYNSAPSNGADFSTASGGGVAPSTDSFLRHEITQLKQSNGFLYQFADSSINVISNVQTSGSPLATTYNNQNVDPVTGTPWHTSVQAFGRTLVFGNSNGVHALIGGAVEKVSDNLDGIFNNSAPLLAVDAIATQPSSAVAIIYGIRVYMLLIPVFDPFTTAYRNAMVMWDGKKWFIGSQVSSLTYIASQEFNSQQIAWGSDGSNLFQLFSASSSSLTKKYQTKLWAGDGFQVTKQAMRLYAVAQDNDGAGYTISGTVDYVLENAGVQSSSSLSLTSTAFSVTWLNGTNGIVVWLNGSSGIVTWTVPGLTLNGLDGGNINQRGNMLGLTMSSTSPDFTLIAHSMLYQQQSPLGA